MPQYQDRAMYYWIVVPTERSTLEQGTAAQARDGMWHYIATTNLPADQHVVIKVNAMDLPGNKGVKTQAQ